MASGGGWYAYNPPMASGEDSKAEWGRFPLVAIAVSLLISLAVAVAFDRGHRNESLFKLANWVGPTAESLLHGNGMAVAIGQPPQDVVFHAARMPVASAVVAVGVKLLGDSFLRVGVFKAVLLLVPVWLAMVLVWRSSRREMRWLVSLLLVAPFFVLPFLADVVNMQVEEGYSYSCLALAVGMLLFRERWANRGIGWGILFAALLDALYLAKSSMALVVVVLVMGYLMVERRAAMRVAVVLLVVAAPVSWAVWQHHASGRYSVGTSLDGFNLHKGNFEQFLEVYPPQGGRTLDDSDNLLQGNCVMTDEWQQSDCQKAAGVAFIEEHPRATVRADLRKFEVFFFSVTKSGSAETKGMMSIAETGGLVVFRLLFWGSLLIAGGAIVTGRSVGRKVGLIYWGVVLACAAPYVVGFAYTRHASVLVYPAVLLCCRALLPVPRVKNIA